MHLENNITLKKTNKLISLELEPLLIWFLLHLLQPNLLKWSYRNVCAGRSGSTRTAQKRREKSKRKGICHILTTGKQCKTSNHSSARELEPVQKDPELAVFNCRWWLLAGHAWRRVRVWLLPACVHCCQPSLQVINMVLRACERGSGPELGVGEAGETPQRHKAPWMQIAHS